MEGWATALVGGHKAIISTKDWDTQVADYFQPLARSSHGFLARRRGKLSLRDDVQETPLAAAPQLLDFAGQKLRKSVFGHHLYLERSKEDLPPVG